MKEHHIVGPPGTGKTTTLQRWATDAARKHGSDSVMISSFTKAAAREIAMRDVPVAEANVGTLHALCYRAMKRPTLAETKLKDWNEYAPEFALSAGKRMLDDPYDTGGSAQGATPGDPLSAQAQRMRQLMIERDNWPSHVAAFQKKWEAWKERDGLVDFTELIETCLKERPIAPNAPRIGFFDEAQDLSRLELALVRSWMQQMEFGVLVYDVDQTLYSFKGADPKALVNVEIPDEHRRVLSKSHRVPASVHKHAVEWIGRSEFRYPAEYEPRDHMGELRNSGSTFMSPQAMIADVKERKGKKMILASCSYMLGNLIKRLRMEGVPFHNPYRRTHGGWNPLARATWLVSFLRPDPRLGAIEGQPRLWTWPEMQAWSSMLQAKGTLRHGKKQLIAARASDTKDDPQPISAEDGRECFEDGVWEELQSAFERRRAPRWLYDHALADAKKRLMYPIEVERVNGIHALLDEPEVIVGTIHSVKGGQAEHVYVFPDLSPEGYREWRRPDKRDSVRRMFYVAATRARESLTLCRPATPRTIRWME